MKPLKFKSEEARQKGAQIEAMLRDGYGVEDMAVRGVASEATIRGYISALRSRGLLASVFRRPAE